MATTLYFRSDNGDYGTGHNDAKLNGSSSGWTNRSLSTSRGSNAASATVTTVAGPTNGIEINGTLPFVFYTPPLDADVTISGSVTWNLRAAESSMSANAAINAVLEVIDGTTGTITAIDTTARTTELGTSEAANNFSETPGAGVACKRGDRLRVRVFADDAGTMASGFTVTFWYAGPTGGGSGDSFITLTEDLTFVSEPAGTQLFLTDDLSAVSTAAIDYEAWTSRGDAGGSDQSDSANGWLSPHQLTDTNGGTVVDWFTRPLEAFTLAGAIRCNLRAREASIAANAALRCEIAVVDGDGTNATTWGATTFSTELPGSEAAQSLLVAGDDMSVDDGQRLRIRVLWDDAPNSQQVSGFNLILFFNGANEGQTGDSWVQLTQSVDEFVVADKIPPSLLYPREAIHRASRW